MKTNAFLKLGVWALGAVLLLTTACNRRNNDSLLEEEDLMQKSAMAEDYFNDAQAISEQAALSGDIATYRLGGLDDIQGGCATITRDTTTSPRSFVVDFGASNCMCRDGKNRRGKILGTYTGRYRDAGTVITLNFDNYFVNDNQVEGTKTIHNEGANANGHTQYHVTVTNGKITLASGQGVITWVADKYRAIVAGENTPTWGDDEFDIWGTRSGTRVNGISYTATVAAATPLHKTAACRFIVSGIATLNSGNKTRTLDFGNGACDNKAMMTIDGKTKEIMLRH